MSDLIPLYGFVDDGVFLTKGGALGVVLRLDGVDYECLEPQQREAVTTRFEVALRVWDERHALCRSTCSSATRRPAGRRASASRRRHVAAAPARAFHAQARGPLHRVACTSSCVVEADASADGAGRAQARRALRAPLTASREWFSSARTIVRLDGDLDRRRAQLRHKVDAFVQQLEDTVAPRLLSKGEAFAFFRRLVNYTPEKADAVRLRAGHVSRLRHLRLGARVSSDASAPRRPLRPRAHAQGAAGAHVSAPVSGALRDPVESHARERMAAGSAGGGPPGDSREAPALPQRQGQSHQLCDRHQHQPRRRCSSTTAPPPSCGTWARP